MSPRLLRPLASGFNPRRIAGLQLWLDAADQSTLFDADTGGSTVTADAAVGRWMDKSGNGRNFTQDTANNRPLWKAAGRNGRGTVQFDGSNDRLLGDATQYAKTNEPFTAIFVHVVDSDAGTYPILFGTKTNQTQNFFWINSSDTVTGGGYHDYGMGSQANFVVTRYTSAARGTWRYVLYDFIGSSASTVASYSARANRAGLSRSTSGAYASNTDAAASIGALNNGNQPLKGQISEILIYSKVLSAAERSAVENYLYYRWDL
jgi:hypothetical protein